MWLVERSKGKVDEVDDVVEEAMLARSLKAGAAESLELDRAER